MARQIVMPRIRVAKFIGIAGLLLLGMLVFGIPALVALPGLEGLDGILLLVLVLVSAIPACVAGAFLATLLLYGLVAWHAARRGGLFVIDRQRGRITDSFGRSWIHADHAPGILLRDRGGGPYSLLLGDFTAVPGRRHARFARWIDRAFTTLWSGGPSMPRPVMALPLFLLTDIDAILATAK